MCEMGQCAGRDVVTDASFPPGSEIARTRSREDIVRTPPLARRHLLLALAGSSFGAMRVPPPLPAQPVLLKSEWGPNTLRRRVALNPSAAAAMAAEAPDHHPFERADDGPLVVRKPPAGFVLRQPSGSVPRTFTDLTLPISGPDPMVAVGRNFIVASQAHSVAFLDRSGAQLPPKNGIGAIHSHADIFGDFADASHGPLDLNRYAGFPKRCNDRSYPQTPTGQRYCVVRFYDLRAYFDAGADRFILVAHARNLLWNDVWNSTGQFTNMVGTCGVYTVSPGKNAPFPDPAHCPLARRYAVFAISKTEDPRDGFHTYAVTENNYQDFPWASVNAEGNTLVIGHKGVEMVQGMSAMVFRLSDLRAGSPTPAYYKLYRQDTGGHLNPSPIVHHGAASALGGRTLLLGSAKLANASRLDVFALAVPTSQGGKPPMLKTSIIVPGVELTHNELRNSVYRNGMLHMAWEAYPPGDSVVHIRVARVPLAFNGSTYSLSTAPANGYRVAWIGKTDPVHATLHDQDPSIAVNRNGDVVVCFIRAGGEQLLFVRWPAAERQPRTETVVRSRSNPDYEPGSTEHSWAVVDPTDDLTFWLANNAKTTNGAEVGVLVRVNP